MGRQYDRVANAVVEIVGATVGIVFVAFDNVMDAITDAKDAVVAAAVGKVVVRMVGSVVVAAVKLVGLIVGVAVGASPVVFGCIMVAVSMARVTVRHTLPERRPRPIQTTPAVTIRPFHKAWPAICAKCCALYDLAWLEVCAP